MRIIIFTLFILLVTTPAFSQVPSQKEIQEQMQSAINKLNKQVTDLEKQIAEAKKNKEDEQVIKDLEDQLIMLQKQVEMMGGLKSTVKTIPNKKIKEAIEEESVLVPRKDSVRIKMLPKKILTESELVLFIKNIHVQVEKMIPIEEKTVAAGIYNDTKAKYRSTTITGNAATSCWMLGHSEKAIYIMGRTCLDSIRNTDNLNNYAAFLIMSGGEQAALPILEYLNKLYPENSTILNNIGQTWFGLGDMERAQQYLDSATILHPNHSMANTSLGAMHLANGDSTRTIEFLRAAIRETYDPDKEAQLTSLGYTLMFADMPPFNYPMEDDPFGFIPMLNTIPENIQTNVHDKAPVVTMQRFVKGLKKLSERYREKNKVMDEKLRSRNQKISTNAVYRNKMLEPHNTPAHIQASRAVQLRAIEANPVPVNGSLDNFPVEKIIANCQKLWRDSVLEPLKILRLTVVGRGGGDCNNVDEAMNAYLAKRQQIYSNGTRLVKTMFVRNSRRLTDWIKHYLYGTIDDPPTPDESDMSYALIGEMEATKSKTIFKNMETINLLDLLYQSGTEFTTFIKSTCPDRQTSDPDAQGDVLAELKPRVECEFRKKVKPSDDYFFELICNTIKEKTDAKLPKKKTNFKKGTAESSRGRNATGSRPPLTRSRGPIAGYDEPETEIISQQAPLGAENKEPSQFSLEYNRWGNLIGFNLQLNKEGTALADPDSVESGIDSRWSWNAIASPKKGFLYKLIIK